MLEYVQVISSSFQDSKIGLNDTLDLKGVEN